MLGERFKFKQSFFLYYTPILCRWIFVIDTLYNAEKLFFNITNVLYSIWMVISGASYFKSMIESVSTISCIT